MKAWRAALLAAALPIFPALCDSIAADGDPNLPARTAGSLDTGAHTKIRVLHFGDSHVAGDAEPAAVRAQLQGLWGDGGPGIGLPWTPPAGYRREGLSSGMSSGWRRFQPTPTGPVTDTGLSGFHIEAASSGQVAWIEGYGSVVRVALLKQPGGGRFEIRVNGTPMALPITTLDAEEPTAVIAGQQTGDHDGPLRVEIRTLGSGKVRVLGTTIENARSGVVYSPLGVVGQRAEALLKWRPETFERLLGAEDPDIVIVAYGTNETAEVDFDVAATARSYAQLIERIRRGAPRAMVFVVSAPDRGESHRGEWHTVRALPDVVRAQREAAQSTQAGFVDLFAAMGGTDSIARWIGEQPPLARSDGTHFTPPVYALLARAIMSNVIGAYGRGKASPDFAPEMRAQQTFVAAASPPARTDRAEATTRLRPAAAAPPGDGVFYIETDDGQLLATNTPVAGRRLDIEEFRAAMQRRSRAER